MTLAGILSSVNRRVTKAGAPWAQVVLEDLEGSIEVMFFPATYAQVALLIAEDAVVSIKGRTDAREDTVKLIASGSRRTRHRLKALARAGARDDRRRPGARRL